MIRLHSYGVALLSLVLVPGSPLSAQCERSKVVASDAVAGDDLGSSVDVDGDWVIAGRPRFDGAAGNGTGGALVIRREPGNSALPGDDVWVEHQFLETADASAGDNVGRQVAISGDWAVLTSSNYDGPGDKSGAAWVFRRDDGGTSGDRTDDLWLEHQRLERAGAALNDRFGFALAMDGDWIGVGAYAADTLANNAGAMTIFRRDDGGTPGDLADDAWLQADELVPADATAEFAFGWTAAMNGPTLVVTGRSAAGALAPAAYVYDLDDGGTSTSADDQWVQLQKIATDGYGVAVDGSWLALTDWIQGRIRFYRREDPNGTPDVPFDDLWELDQSQLSSFLEQEGFASAMSGRLYVTGAPGQGEGTNDDERGATGAWRRELGATPALADDVWRRNVILYASDQTPDVRYGAAVALDGPTLAVGAPGDSEAADGAGAVYVHHLAPLCSATDELSLSAGGTLELLLEPWDDIGVLGSSGTYWILGSVSGTSPGIDFGAGGELPLVFDAYTKVTIKKVFSPLYTAFLDDFFPANSTLDSAPASFHLPPGSLPDLAGLTLYHAYALSQDLGDPVQYVSNAVATLLVP